MCVFVLSRYNVDCLRPFAVRGEYRKSTAGGQSVTTIATGVEFVFEQGAVMVKYTQDGKTRKFDITAKLVAQNFTVSGGIEIENDRIIPAQGFRRNSVVTKRLSDFTAAYAVADPIDGAARPRCHHVQKRSVTPC